MGLAPRPADAWDLACLRYWLAVQPGTTWRVVKATKVLTDEHGCRTAADFDDALSHGETVAACRLVAEF